MQRRPLLAGAAVLAMPGIARAQAWPSQPIRVIVPYPPGGSNDVMGRYLSERLAPVLGQPIAPRTALVPAATSAPKPSRARRRTAIPGRWCRTRC